MGFEQIKAARMFENGDTQSFAFEQLPVTGQVSTTNALGEVTDSAAAGTAMATGRRVLNGVVSTAIPGDGSELTTALEIQSAGGKRTGLVTTDAKITDATPAAFGAHDPDRFAESEIANDYFSQTRPNVLFGFDGPGISIAAATNAGYVAVTSEAELQALTAPLPEFVSGQFTSTTIPALASMTARALDILDNPGGFFLLVEHEGIDEFGHANDLSGQIESVLALRDAVDVALNWAAGRDDTLIIVTSDHETGGLIITEANPVPATLPSHSYSTNQHTAIDVPLYATGPDATRLAGLRKNTDLFPVLAGFPAPAGQAVFQDGVSPSAGYFGTRDTSLVENQPDTAFGGDGTVFVDGEDPSGSGQQVVGLMQWDVSGLAPGSVVESVGLTLQVTNKTNGAYEIYAQLAPWNEAEASWNESAAGTAWQTPGAQGAQERGTTLLGTVSANTTGSYSTFLNAAGVAVVQGWVDDPASNHGLVIASTTVTNGLDFASSEAAVAGDRPMLTVTLSAPDADGDGVPDDQDAFPDDDTEWLDTDGDGIGNNSDTDDDNDLMPDDWELQWGFDPLDPSDAAQDADGDGLTNLEEYQLGTVPVPPEPPTPVTTAFQDGVSPDVGYFGTRDTSLVENQPDTAFGGDATVFMDGEDPSGSGQQVVGLMQWDVSGLASGSVVESVELTLQVTDKTNGAYEIYAQLAPWNEAEASWNESAAGTAWQVPGAQGAQERGTTLLGTISATTIGSYSTFLNAAGVAVVQGWVDDPASNHGLVIASTTVTNGLDFDSSEAAVAGDRPILTITALQPSGPDADGDGVPDDQDAFPDDPTEWLDTDGDRIGNNADPDDDGDGVPDVDDAFPLDANEWLDTDGDGIGNNADTDDDGDGIPDVDDPFPLDPLDSDGDGIPDHLDSDDDNDGIPDSWELFYSFDPLFAGDANEDNDLDGVNNLGEFLQGSHPRSVSVLPAGETDPIPRPTGGGGDIDTRPADDPAIWLHPTDPAQSRVIGTDKQRGLAVYDLAGNEIQFVFDGEMNNVDLRYDFLLDNSLVDVVAATNRTDDTIRVYTVDPVTGFLTAASAGGGIGAGIVLYGTCMYQSPISGKTYVFVNSKDGEVEQWELTDSGSGLIDGVLVRSFDVGTQTEGCVADDEFAVLYIGEENVGIWRYGAEPDVGEQRIQVDVTGPSGHLTVKPVEGLTIYHSGDGTGYLIASNQGDNDYVIYRREGNNEYVGTFNIVDGNGIGGTFQTDGVDVISTALGSTFPQGLFVAHDQTDINFKLVYWDAIATAFSPALTIDTSWSPRPDVGNRAPFAVDDSYGVDQDSVLDVPAESGVLANDTDPEGGLLLVNPVPVQGPVDGALVLASDGSFTYTPDQGFVGSDGFVYEVTDDQGAANQASVSILVGPVNQAPSVAITVPADNTSVVENTLVTFVGGAGDAEDGDLSAAIAWESDLEGSLGNGASISTTLTAVGSHTITARVVDSGGAPAQDQITVIVTALPPPPPPGSGPVSFQDGVSPSAGYFGTRDTSLVENQPDTAFGGDATVFMDGEDPSGSGQQVVGLMQWDVSGLASGSVVESVEMTLQVTDKTNGAYEIYAQLAPWNEAEASWNESAAGTAWQAPGAQGAQERGTTLLGTISATTIGSYSTFLNAAGVAVVQGWVDDPASNHGLVIASTTVTNGLDFDSSEAAVAGDRPMLTITILGPDADGDGVPDDQDAFPDDDTEWLDTDGDRIGNNADTDDDNDLMPDDWELQWGFDPLDPSDAAQDTDGDGLTNLEEYQQGTVPVPPPGGIWLFDEGAGGTAFDQTLNANDGTLTGIVNWTSGINGSAVSFAREGRILVPDNASLDITNQITLAAWVKPDQERTQRVVLKSALDSADGFELSLAHTFPGDPNPVPSVAFVRFNQASSGNAYRLESSSLYPHDGATWMHVAATYDGSDIRIYIDGLLEGTLPAPGLVIGSNSEALSIGAAADGTFPYSGVIDDLYVRDYAMDAAAIGALAMLPPDADGDGVPDDQDAFPDDDTEWLDTDGDGIGNNADPDDDNDLMPDDWELQWGFDPLDPSDAAQDADGDGLTNLEEYQQGTVPVPGGGGIWPFDEGSGGTAFDQSANANDGALTGSASWTTGVSGSAVNFSGAGHVSVADHPSLDITDAITLAVWIRPDQRATQRILTKSLYRATDGYELGLSNSQETAFVRFNQASSGNTYRINASSVYPQDGSTWMHVAATYDGSELRLYIDGVLEGTLQAPGLSINSNTLPLSIGAQSDGQYQFAGAIDELYVHDYAMDAAAIANLASVQPPPAIGLSTWNAENLQPFVSAASVGEKPQSKVWQHDNTWWMVMPDDSVTYLWRLDGNLWTPTLMLTDLALGAKADVLVSPDDPNVVHVLVVEGLSTQLISLEYAAGNPGSYVPWAQRPLPANVAIPVAAETATIAIDSTARMWVAYDNSNSIEVLHSPAPYSDWTAPAVVLENGVADDDIAAITQLNGGAIGVMWSNANDKLFGFRTHSDGDDPTIWTADETPAAQSALNVGNGMSDDHINTAIASDGTLYAAIKTSYGSDSGFVNVALLIRRPSGQWDDLYPVDILGTRPIVVINESEGFLAVIYAEDQFGGDIVYKESPLSGIVFSGRKRLISGTTLTEVSSTKAPFVSDLVVLASGRLSPGQEDITSIRLTAP